jgi:hypothetical protein
MSIDGNSPAAGKATSCARAASWPRGIVFHLLIIVLCLVSTEVFLRVIDWRDLRLRPEEVRLPHRHDPELGWALIPNKVAIDGTRINSLGLRDIEILPTSKPTILFVGDSFVYGMGVADDERFTDRLREQLPQFRIVNAGVSGYGTDQAYLLMRRLWPRLKPSVVVLIFCVVNDHIDNSASSRHGHTFKPYLAHVDGEWKFQGIPVPHPHTWYFYNNWLAARFAVVRLAIHAYTHLRYPKVVVPDPTAQLVVMMRDFIESRGAKFLVGLQYQDRALEPHLIAQGIPYTRLGDAELIPGDDHWSPQGHRTVARRLLALFRAENLIKATLSQ